MTRYSQNNKPITNTPTPPPPGGRCPKGGGGGAIRGQGGVDTTKEHNPRAVDAKKSTVCLNNITALTTSPAINFSRHQ